MRPEFRQLFGTYFRTPRAIPMFRYVALLAVGTSACTDHDDVNYLSVSTQMTPLSSIVDVIVEQPGQRNVIRAKEAGQAAQNEVRVNTGKSGNMLVIVVVKTAANDTISVGQVTLPLHSNYVYAVSVSRQKAGQISQCLGPGCNGEVKFPFRGSEAVASDSMWIRHYGGILCKDCIY